MTKLVLPYPPSGNHYKRHFCTVNRGHPVMAVVLAATKRFKHDVGWIAKDAYREPLSGPVALTVALYRPRRSGDTDNLLKVLMDALNGILWHDDRQVSELHVYRCEDKYNPRCEVEARSIGGNERE